MTNVFLNKSGNKLSSLVSRNSARFVLWWLESIVVGSFVSREIDIGSILRGKGFELCFRVLREVLVVWWQINGPILSASSCVVFMTSTWVLSMYSSCISRATETGMKMTAYENRHNEENDEDGEEYLHRFSKQLLMSGKRNESHLVSKSSILLGISAPGRSLNWHEFFSIA